MLLNKELNIEVEAVSVLGEEVEAVSVLGGVVRGRST